MCVVQLARDALLQWQGQGAHNNHSDFDHNTVDDRVQWLPPDDEDVKCNDNATIFNNKK
ncbi:hypothetical protein TSUD_241210 [Trifolium subterraneum]|uniref:Uncharacterized protein n=1 Tax=Trifolium subterraneum TaxID=3900 RepID=A0A2Z6NHF1_TRISU|nr:hypothetical protein TSUD_241210 [Trifolium subterraneum]